MNVIKALLFTLLLFVAVFATASLPVLLGEVGVIILFAIIFLGVFLLVLFSL